MTCIAYRGRTPCLKPGAFAAHNATLVGDVTLEKGAAFWYGVAARGDHSPIHIGEGTNIQENCVLHVSEVDALTVGKRITVGHGTILHGCTVGDDCLIGMGAILMDGCVIGEGSIVAAGALVPQGVVIPPRSLVMGAPAKVRRQTTEADLAEILDSAARYEAWARELFEAAE